MIIIKCTITMEPITECNVHVLRYLNAVSELINHAWAKKLHDLLLDMNKRRIY